MILLMNLLEEMIQLKRQLSAMFKITDMATLSYCLGIGVRQGEGWLQIQQCQYLLNIVKRFGLEDVHPVATRANVSVTLEADDGVSKPVDQQNYQQMIGSLLYASGGTRPDVTSIVGVLARYCGKPNQLHLTAAKRVLRYLKGTSKLVLTYMTEGSIGLTGYSDADWAGDRDTRRSTSGMAFLPHGASINWSKRQTSVASSTVEGEYMALSQATQEAVWLQQLLEEVGESTSEGTTIMEDNQGAMATARNPVFHCRTKHIQIYYHYVREAVAEGIIRLVYCPTKEMLADIFTKALARDQLENLREKLGLQKLRSCYRCPVLSVEA